MVLELDPCCEIVLWILKFLLALAWQLVQFWTPLSLSFISMWILYGPSNYHPHVDSAVLADLHLTNTSLLQYDLAVDLSLRNSLRGLSIRYIDGGATAFYNTTRLGPTVDSLPTFLQRPKNTTVLHMVFRDVAAVSDPAWMAILLTTEQHAGALHFKIRVWLTLLYDKSAWFTVFYKFFIESKVKFYTYDCWIWFPPPRNATPASYNGGSGSNCWRAK